MLIDNLVLDSAFKCILMAQPPDSYQSSSERLVYFLIVVDGHRSPSSPIPKPSWPSERGYLVNMDWYYRKMKEFDGVMLFSVI